MGQFVVTMESLIQLLASLRIADAKMKVLKLPTLANARKSAPRHVAESIDQLVDQMEMFMAISVCLSTPLVCQNSRWKLCRANFCSGEANLLEKVNLKSSKKKKKGKKNKKSANKKKQKT